MSIRSANRLDRLLPALTFDERLDGLLAAYREERRADPGLFGTMPSSDNQRWNEAARILNAVHSRLGWVIDYLEASVTQGELRLALAEQQRIVSALFEGEAQEQMVAIGAALAKRAMAHVLGCWDDLRLIELTLAHLSERLGGRPLLRDVASNTLADCRKRLLGAHERLGLADGFALAFDLPEPTEGSLETMLDLLMKEKYLA